MKKNRKAMPWAITPFEFTFPTFGFYFSNFHTVVLFVACS